MILQNSLKEKSIKMTMKKWKNWKFLLSCTITVITKKFTSLNSDYTTKMKDKQATHF